MTIVLSLDDAIISLMRTTGPVAIDSRGTQTEVVRTLLTRLRRCASGNRVARQDFETVCDELGLRGDTRERARSALPTIGLVLSDGKADTAKAPSRPPRSGPPPRPAAAPPAPCAVPGADSPRPRAAARLVSRYAIDRRVERRVLDGAARIFGLTSEERNALPDAVRALGLSVPEPTLNREETDATAEKAAPVPASEEPPATGGEPEAGSSGTASGDLAAAVAAAERLLEEDRFRRRPDKRLLTAEEEVGLFVLLRTPEALAIEPTEQDIAKLPNTHVRRRAYDAFVLHNQRLVYDLAKEYVEQGLDEEDLVQHGMRGVMRAVVKFDARRGNKFSTYATWWIKQAITRAIADEGALIRLPVHFHELVKKVAATERRLLAQGRSIGVANVAVEADVKVSDVESVRRLARRMDSLDRVVNGDTVLIELVDDRRNALPSPEELVLTALGEEEVNLLLATLDDRSRDIMRRRLGLFDGRKHTLDEIGKVHGITRERIRQLEGRAIELLRARYLGLPDPPKGGKKSRPKQSVRKPRKSSKRAKQATRS